MVLLLQDFFQRRYGAQWKQAYIFPELRVHLLNELREDLADQLDGAVIVNDAPGAEDPTCRCNIHRFFGVRASIRFPNCSKQQE